MRLILAAILALPLFAPASAAPAGRQEDPVKKLSSRCDTQIDWLTDGVAVGDNDHSGRRPPKVDTVAVFDKAKALAKERNRLILWYVPRVWGPHMYRPALPDGYARIGLFTHPDVVALVRRKFVPMRVVADRPMSEATGVKRFEVVEPAIVLMTPDGKAVHTIDRIRTFNPDWLVAVLVAALRKNPDYNEPAKDASSDELILGGDYDKVAFKESDRYRQAIVARRRMKGDEALKSLERLTGGEGAVERGRVLLGMGKVAEALAQFETSNRFRARNARADEAIYYEGLCHYYLGNDKKAEEQWRDLLKLHPDGAWAWRAAGNLVRDQDTMAKGPALHGFEDPFWPAEEACGLAAGTRWPRKRADADDATRRGVEFLLRMQRSHGGWDDSRYCYWPDQKILPNVWISVSAVAAAALLDWRDLAPDRIDAAVAKAEKYFLDEARMARGINEEVYADTFKILYLVRKQELKADPKNLDAIARIARELARTQDKRGFWGHEYPNPFCTAAVVHALRRARDAGAKIDESLIKKAGEGLLSTRGQNGEQAYDSERGPSPMKDSMARVVQCEYALFVAGRVEIGDVSKAFENYWKFRDRLHAVRVCDFHSDGELAGFFLYHSIYFTAEAVTALPKDDRRAECDRFLDWVLSMSEMDGSFLDSHELGKSYGTAMALRVLKSCASEGK